MQDADAAAWGKLKEGGGPILGIYGMDDTSPSPEQAKKFEEALVKNKLKHNITIYEGVGHAFIQPEYHKDSQSKGHATAVKAWNQITRFLKDAFNTNSSSTGSNRRALSVVPYVVPFHISLYHKMQCALKCSQIILLILDIGLNTMTNRNVVIYGRCVKNPAKIKNVLYRKNI